jgi:hypothetical protein
LCVSDIGRFLVLAAMVNLAKSGAAHSEKSTGGIFAHWCRVRRIPRTRSRPDTQTDAA